MSSVVSSVINFSVDACGTKQYPLSKVIHDRKKLNKYVGLLYTDRSNIDLRGIKGCDKRDFLNLDAHCKKCLKKKKLWQYYKDNRISDICHNCSTKQEIYDILIDIIKEANNV